MSKRKKKQSHAVRAMTAVVLILLFATGMLFFLRPFIIDRKRINSENQLIQMIEQGETEIMGLHLPEIEGEQYEYEDEDMLDGMEAFIEDVIEDTEPLEEESTVVNGYAVISIPSIELKMAVVKGVDKMSLRCGAGWLPDSAPIGAAGNCVIMGHRMKSYGRHFNRLDELTAGDEINLTVADGSSFGYTVTGKDVLLPEEVSAALASYTDGFKLTLVTCTPTGVGSHRLLIYCDQN